LVLSGLIRREFLQHQTQIFFRSSFKLSIAVVVLVEGKDK